MSYAEYLNSWHWAITKGRVKAAAGRVCELCGSRQKLEVHHWTYKRLGDERVDDLLVVCACCHEDIHAVEHTDFQYYYSLLERLRGRYQRVKKNKIYGPIKADRIISKIFARADQINEEMIFPLWVAQKFKRANTA